MASSRRSEDDDPRPPILSRTATATAAALDNIYNILYWGAMLRPHYNLVITWGGGAM